MLLARLRCLIVAFILTASLTAAEPRVAQAQDDLDPDSVTPIASSIQTLDNIELALGGEKRTLSLAYARQGATAFPLPVWLVDGDVEFLSGSGPVQSRRCMPEQPLVRPSDQSPMRLRVRLVNLLAEESTRKAVQTRLREEIAQLIGQKPEAIRLDTPVLDRSNYRITLCASGSGGNDQPAEIVLSLTGKMPPLIPQGSGEVDLELSPINIAAWQAVKARPITLRDVYLRIEGTMRARFERQMYQTNFTLVSQSLTNLQNRLRSITPSVREAPEVLVHVPIGGEVEQTRSTNTVFTQFLIGTINVREGADRDLGAVQQLTERVLGKVLQQVVLNDLEDKKRVALLLGDHVTLSATVGEVRDLSGETREERNQQLKSTLDHWESTHKKEDRDYKGSLGVDVSIPQVPVTVGEKLEGSVKKSLEQEQARRRQEALDLINRGLDEVKKHFAGRIPTLSGIQFDQKGLASSLGQIELELKQNSFTTGWSHYEWPAVRLNQAGMEPFSPHVLAAQLDQARARYEEFQKLIDSPERLKAFDSAYARVVELEKNLKANNDAATSTAMDLRKMLKEHKKVPMLVGDESFTLRMPKDGNYSVYCNVVAFSADCKQLIATRSSNGKSMSRVDFWDVSTGKVVHTLESPLDSTQAVAISPDGKRIAYGGYLKESGGVVCLEICNPPAGQGLDRQLIRHTQTKLIDDDHRPYVLCVAFTLDGKLLASGAKDGTVKVWDTANGKEVRTLTGHTAPVCSVTFDSDDWLASGDAAGTVKFWTDHGEASRDIKYTSSVRSVDISPDSNGVDAASGCKDGTVFVHSGRSRGDLTLKGHASGVNSVAFSPDSTRIASGSNDETVRIWDANSGQELCTLRGHTGPVNSVVFSPDGTRVASGSEDGTVKVWTIQTYMMLGMPKRE